MSPAGRRPPRHRRAARRSRRPSPGRARNALRDRAPATAPVAAAGHQGIAQRAHGRAGREFHRLVGTQRLTQRCEVAHLTRTIAAATLMSTAAAAGRKRTVSPRAMRLRRRVVASPVGPHHRGAIHPSSGSEQLERAVGCPPWHAGTRVASWAAASRSRRSWPPVAGPAAQVPASTRLPASRPAERSPCSTPGCRAARCREPRQRRDAPNRTPGGLPGLIATDHKVEPAPRPAAPASDGLLADRARRRR